MHITRCFLFFVFFLIDIFTSSACFFHNLKHNLNRFLLDAMKRLHNDSFFPLIVDVCMSSIFKSAFKCINVLYIPTMKEVTSEEKVA